MSTNLSQSFTGANAAVTSVRKIPVQKLLDYAVDGTAEILKREDAPGVIIGLSGTDSFAAAAICIKAFIQLGKPLKNIRIVNFQHETHDADQGMDKLFACAKTEDTKWVERELFPWFRKHYPEVRLEVDTSIKHSADGARWGAIHDKAKDEVNGRGDLMGTYYFIAGSRNATEDAIGGYTLITKGVSFFPIRKIYKTEIIDICRYLGAPEIAIEKSRDIDCDCGRFEVQAYKMDQLDTYIMARKGLIDKTMLEALDPQDLIDVRAFYGEENALNEFKADDRAPHQLPDFEASGSAPAPAL